jgi:hypothetical protein
VLPDDVIENATQEQLDTWVRRGGQIAIQALAEINKRLVEKWENGETIEVAKFLIDSKGITKKLGPHEITFSFDEMKLYPRFDHLLINSKLKDDKFMKLIYLDHWNWPLVNEIVNRAINEKE